MSKKESKTMDIYQQLRNYENIYNTLNEYDPDARFQTNFRIYVQFKNLDGAEITDKFVVETLIKYYADKINKLKQELKKELDKEL